MNKTLLISFPDKSGNEVSNLDPMFVKHKSSENK